MNKSEMFDWLIDNKASIFYHPLAKWTKENGEVFYTDFILSAKGTQFAPAETLEEAINQAKVIYP